MRQITFSCLVILIIFICSSCSYKQYQSFFQQQKSISDTSKESAVTLKDYKIKPQDVLQIRNLQNSKNIVDLNPSLENTATPVLGAAPGETLQVEDDGTIALTGLGRVPVAGLTRTEIQKLIEDLYRKSLLKDPIFEVKITSLKVTFLGEIRSQGNLPLIKERTTLVEMIGAAGGLSDRADETNIKIIRGTEKNPEVTIVDLRDIHSINDPKTLLQNGDIIYVAQNKRAIRNDNLQNFSTVFQPLLLLFNTALIIFTLIRK